MKLIAGDPSWCAMLPDTGALAINDPVPASNKDARIDEFRQN
ncbi:MAG TPA: hypothetical protein VNE42_06230 [Acidimicrobiales bacterium]|nr:hypothetical protein [Acidimicrobiales bacterium]